MRSVLLHRTDGPWALEIGLEHFFGVYDGHGGRRVADYAAERLHVIVGGQLGPRGTDPPDGSYEGVLRDGFAQLNAELLAGVPVPPGNVPVPGADRTGCTAVVAIVDGGGGGDLRLTIANVGDCRAVLCLPRPGDDSVGYVGQRLSVDHKPNTPDETARIAAQPGASIIIRNGVHRVGGGELRHCLISFARS